MPWLKDISEIVRFHHRDWKDWNEGLENPLVLSSQIVYLSDQVERLIDRNRYILHQTDDITEAVRKLQKENKVCEKLAAHFIDISKKKLSG
ncbi:hypothetical protein [Thermoclostridium stercorarium]|uniref:hypothetical protein n=1 Tax=Thermoclostridium stercorarium TaxID=1510 RepID=UPI002B05276E|nr:hypothetical protein [Thermoclostridium stercorarium]